MVHGKWKWMEEELQSLKEKSQLRTLHDTSLLENGWVLRGGKKMLNLASNDYLGLSESLNENKRYQFMKEEEPISSSLRFGSTASRLIVGNDPIYREFEKQFASYKGTEDCLVFSSGYMANLGVISALIGRKDLVLSDRLNHASIVDGIILSRAEHKRYKHRDIEHLEYLLKNADSNQRKLIVTDSIFSMDGSIAPLEKLVELKNRYGAMLMVDEAHSGGIYGAQGQGLVHSLGLSNEVDIQMGTFSKAYGCYGAYIAGDSILIQYLMNKARSFIFTTALPPINIAVILQNWLRVQNESWRQKSLLEKSAWFKKELQFRGFNTGESESQIIPIIVGDNKETLNFSNHLQEKGVAALAVRPPTVPEGTARIRFTIMSIHQEVDLKEALVHIGEIGQQLKITL
ncbi:8-amino-7-oxononanoate synthase [Chengkuizengella axinellae]|uniref:8-amino-7-ketopelargonate synthase n=1 Tax=Chengkuizengella axinellae TaxID=3064388 RepID=A0ABT9J018_9BACL|nr:8-amino-7-oxononanoate synthase [Chengkuizengella sp. 2205SS18-9]MDP5274959.1 8-amino-7-oxononanoate synthase [Chengkuizengella sp. 2205SS18-9]